MKVLVTTPSVLPEEGGPAYSVSSVASYLNDVGCETVLATRAECGGASLSTLIRHRAFQCTAVVHNFGIWTPFNHRVSMLARHADKPLIICPMGMLEPWAMNQKALKKRMGWGVYQRRDVAHAAAIQATAHSEAENLRMLGIRVPIAVIPHGIDLPVRVPKRARTRSGSRSKTVLFMSRIHPKKGLLDLVDAWSQLRPSDWRAVIAGPDQGGHRAQVEEAVRAKGLQDAFEFTGVVSGDEKAMLFAAADLFVLPTYSENFGLVIPEALAYEVPVITTTGAPWSELVEARCGWWIRPEVPSLVDALAEAFALPAAELAAMGQRGRTLVENSYTWPDIIRQHIRLYEWLIQRGERPDFILD